MMKASSLLIAVLLLFACSVCRGNGNNFPTKATTAASVGPFRRRKKQSSLADEVETHLLPRRRSTTELPAKQSTAALIGAGAGVAATVFCQHLLYNKKRQLLKRYHDDVNNRHINHCRSHVVDRQHIIQQRRRRGGGALRILTILTLCAGLCAMLLVLSNEGFFFGEQFKQYLSTVNSNVAIPFRTWVNNSVMPFFGMILHRLGTFLTVILQWTFDVGGAMVTLLTSVGLVLLLVAVIVAMVIALPTLQAIGQDLRDDLRQHYKRERWRRRWNGETLWEGWS